MTATKNDSSVVDIDNVPTKDEMLEVRDVKPKSNLSSIMMVLVGGIALFSDGYNAQIVGHMNPVLAALYPDDYTKQIKTRVSNAFLIGEVFGMLFFGWAIDRLGRRTGIFWATLFLVLGIVLTTAAHGTSPTGMFWMIIIGRGVAGFGAGGEYPTCATSSTEAADETEEVRRRRGILTAIATDFSIDLGFVIAGVVALIVLAAYHGSSTEGVWRISYGLGIVLPLGVLFARLSLVNSSQYHKHAMKKDIPYLLIIKRYWKPMLGTSLAWFFYDFVVSNNLICCHAFTDNCRPTPLASSAAPSSAPSAPTTASPRASATVLSSTASTCPAPSSAASSWTASAASRP